MSALQKSKALIKFSSNAEEVFRGLNGIFCIYKTEGNKQWLVRNTLLHHICRDMNELEVRPPENYVNATSLTNSETSVKVELNYADHPLVVGPRYQPQDFKLFPAHYLSRDMSGVMLMGLNRGCGMIKRIRESNPMKFYKLKGILGQASDNYYISGKIAEKTTFKHIKRHHLDQICAAMQSSHQRKMFEFCGVDIQSQAAYDLAVQGPLRTNERNIPMVYSIKCIDFDPPNFTLEIVCINEDDLFLKSIIHTVGMEARSTATCTQVQLFQYGVFTLDSALLKRDWDLENISENILHIRQILGKHKYLFNQEDPILREYTGSLKPKSYFNARERL